MLDTRKVKALREKKGLSLEDAAKAVGLDGLRDFYAIETGDSDISMGLLDKIADVLGVEPAELVKRTEVERAAKSKGSQKK
jgi:transcriptional regulator with XRE-family HTH domain